MCSFLVGRHRGVEFLGQMATLGLPFEDLFSGTIVGDGHPWSTLYSSLHHLHLLSEPLTSWFSR